MRTSIFLITFFSIFVGVPEVHSQSLCPTGVVSDKLICLIPHIYGENGLILGSFQANQFQNNFLTSNLSPLNSAIGRQSAILPLASPSSGITYSWDTKNKVYLDSAEGFGPIFGERAETVGKYALFLGFSYQQFKFEKLDALDLTNLPVVFTQPDFPLGTRTCSIKGDSMTQCGFIRDVIRADNQLKLDAQQVTTFVAFGLTNRLEVSMAFPIERMRMSMTSVATIVNNVNSPTTVPIHFFLCGNTPCTSRTFSSEMSASGMSDIFLRFKGVPWKGERARMALGVDIRFPTGNDLNLLGSGAAGVKPFLVWSYKARVSPNLTMGFESNGSSRIAGDISIGTKERLPDQLTYSAGADVWITRRVAAAFNLVGQEVFQAKRTVLSNFTEPGACLDPAGTCIPALGIAIPKIDPNLGQATGSYHVSNAAVGLRVRPVSGLLLTGNVLLKLNDGGLRPDVIPLFGLSYTFKESAQ